MMRKLPALVPAAVLALALAAGPASAATKPTCKRSHTTTVTQNSTTRVYQKTKSGVTTLYGCLKSKGKAVKLDVRDLDPELGTDFSKVRLAGRFVAWAHRTSDNTCKADCPPDYDPTTDSVGVRDLRLNKTRTHLAGKGATAVVLSAKGALAWTQ